MAGPLCVTVPSRELELEPFSSARLEDCVRPPTPYLIRAALERQPRRKTSKEKEKEKSKKQGKKYIYIYEN